MVPIRHLKRPALTRKLALAVALGLALGVIVGVAAYAGSARGAGARPATGPEATASTGSACDAGPRPAIGKYPGDSNNDGTINDQGSERIPALIAAVASNGVAGYVKYSDLFCQPAPASPAAALAAQGSPQTIPVYASDGTTIVGQFIIGAPDAVVTSPGGLSVVTSG